MLLTKQTQNDCHAFENELKQKNKLMNKYMIKYMKLVLNVSFVLGAASVIIN